MVANSANQAAILVFRVSNSRSAKVARDPDSSRDSLSFLGRALLELGIAALRLLEFGLQPRHLIPLFLQLGLVRKLALLLCGCAKVADVRM